MDTFVDASGDYGNAKKKCGRWTRTPESLKKGLIQITQFLYGPFLVILIWTSPQASDFYIDMESGLSKSKIHIFLSIFY